MFCGTGVPLKQLYYGFVLTLLFDVFTLCHGQSEVSLPVFSAGSLRNIIRAKTHTPPGRVAKLSDIRLLHYGDSPSNFSSYTYGALRRARSLPGLGPARPAVIYVHGYVERADDESVRAVVAALLRRGSHSVLALDWANLAYGNYALVALDVPAVGGVLAACVRRLLRLGVRARGLHLVGHSLGAHAAAAAARRLRARGLLVPRLTGLDPALPGFYPPLAVGAPLTARDAAFVDVIHTDAGRYGAAAAAGHADFWPNGGAAQPGCARALPLTVEDFCSHWRSWRYWAESLSAPFPARRCGGPGGRGAPTAGGCRGPVALMGFGATPDLRGNFYLRTAPESPFSLGMRGVD